MYRSREAKAAYMRRYNASRTAEQKARRAQVSRASYIKRRYGLTPEQYDQMLESQGGGCAVCGITEAKPLGDRRKTWSFDVDHDHETGAVRGLLCQPCNRAIGQAGEDPDRLRRLAEYLERARLA